MSVDYTAVLVDLRAKRDALDNLIAALENVARLNGPVAAPVPTLALPRAEKVVRPSVRPSVRTKPVPPRAKATPNRRATVAPPDDAVSDKVVMRVNSALGGIRLADLVSAFPSSTTSTEIKTAMLRLVASGRITRHGAGRGSRYWPAGTTAKEAL